MRRPREPLFVGDGLARVILLLNSAGRDNTGVRMKTFDEIAFEDYRASWLEDVTKGDPSTVELGRRFALKLITQWMEDSIETDNFIYCDGSRDGGIDLALLDTGPEEAADETGISGHTWYLVQSKYGSAFAGPHTLLVEGQKVIDTLDGKRERLNSLAEGVMERLSNFKRGAGPSDRIVLVFATEAPLSEDEKRALADLRSMGTTRLGSMFDIEALSIETIFARLQEIEAVGLTKRLRVSLDAQMVPSGPDLLVGSVGLPNLYAFLKLYRDETGDLDRIYEKNVRRFLGARGKVNKAMQSTLRDAPERFGLYNNGITIVVHDYSIREGAVDLAEPFIVNGCQTTRTIWEVFHTRLSSGGTGVNPETEAWKAKADQGVVVAKVVKVGNSGENLLQAITRYTNSQNAIREKDFLALTGDFKTWQGQLADQYDLYLEIQRGGWDSQKALQNTNPTAKQFTEHANAADLIKVYGAGWMGEAGLAFGKNPPFLPDGSVFKRIVNGTDVDGGAFGVTDLYAAYLLQKYTAQYGFGRGAPKQSRRQSRFLYFLVVLDLFKDVLTRASYPTDHRSVAAAMVEVLKNDSGRSALLDQAAEVIDSYFTQGNDDSLFNEPSFLNSFNADLNAFLKWEKLARSDVETPRLKQLLAVNKSVMGMSLGGSQTPRQTIMAAVYAT